MKIFTRVLCMAAALVVMAMPGTGAAQQRGEPDTAPPEQIQPIIVPIITSRDNVPLSRLTLFDASDSSLLPESSTPPVYLWAFSDMEAPYRGKEVVRSFDRTGTYTVTLTITQGQERATREKEIFVYDKGVLFIVDKKMESSLAAIREQAAEQGVLLEVVALDQHETEFLSEESLVQALAAKAEFVDGADAHVFFTESQLGLRGFTRYWRGLESSTRSQAYRQRFYAVITEGNMEVMAGIAQQTFEVIRPSSILLTRKEALNPIFETHDFNAVASVLDQRAIEFRIIDERSERSWIFLLTRLISRFVSQGVPSNVIYLLLAFPFIVFLIAFAREVLGFSAFGVYTPAMVATALLILGIEFGLLVFLIVVLVGWGVRWLVDRVELLFIPRTGLVLSSLALSFLLIIWALLIFQSAATISLAVFPMLVMSTVTEKFLAAQAEEGVKHAVWGVVRTIVVVVVAYYAVTWTPFANLITATPEYVLVPLIALFILGKFTGLRLNEYFRFRSLLREGAEE